MPDGVHTGEGMHRQMIYYVDERAREMEMAAAERQMGCSCSPLGRMISRVILRCYGREGHVRADDRLDYVKAYPPAQTYYVRPAANTVTYATNNHRSTNAYSHAVPPEPPRTYTTALPGAAAPPPGSTGKPRKKKKKRVRFTPTGPVPADAPPPHGPHAPQHAAGAASGGATAPNVYHHGAAEPTSYTPAPPVHGQGYGYGLYAPSPLARWDMLGTPRRHEYFSSEYRWYYPTPVREKIYSIATDANRLTSIFSEENPNACTIV